MKEEHNHPKKPRFNTGEYASAAVATAKANLAYLAAGTVWTHTAPRGEFEIKGSLLLCDQVVVALHFSCDGSILPRGLHALKAANDGVYTKIKEQLKNVAGELTVLEGAEFRAPEDCWVVPLAHRGRIVAHIRVSADGSRIVEDKRVAAESAQALS